MSDLQGPIQLVGDLTVTGDLIQRGVSASFGNVTVTGTFSAPGPFTSGVIGCVGLKALAFNHVVGVDGGVEISGGLIVGHDLSVRGDIQLVNADCAEEFDIGAEVLAGPGAVMVFGEDGALYPCRGAYDKRVAGVLSGAGHFKPGIVLDKRRSDRNRLPLALIGKTFCNVDASYGPIEVGDMLTTSQTLGHAMKANDPLRAFGSVIGKALQPLAKGLGQIPILIALQ
jgi:hypothetical protein